MDFTSEEKQLLSSMSSGLKYEKNSLLIQKVNPYFELL